MDACSAACSKTSRRALSHEAPRFRGELIGARTANLLAGVWSTRTPLKLRNRRVETLLGGLGRAVGALGAAVRHSPTNGRRCVSPGARCCRTRRTTPSAAARSIASTSRCRRATTRPRSWRSRRRRRVLERLAGLGPERRTPSSETFDIAVFNPSPHPRTDVVRFALDPAMWLEFGGETTRQMALHPWLLAGLTARGFTVDGQPARLIADDTPGRLRLTPEALPQSVEFVAADVPAFGWRRFTLAPAAAHPDQEDDGREIASGDLRVRVADDGTFELRTAAGVYAGLVRHRGRGRPRRHVRLRSGGRR